MCGIAGLINCGNERLLHKMIELIAHRGPDNAGIKWFDEINSGLGHRRLSIIDLTPAGHQPMCNERGNLWITYNGELYNYKEIRNELINIGYKFRSQSDTEVILIAYEEWAENCLNKFNGMFAFAIYDTKSRILFAARDRIGIKPFYYYCKNGIFIFASEIKAILASSLIEKEPDYYALYTPTRYQISPLTGFKNINKLPPGHFLCYGNGNLKIRKYWDIKATDENHLNENEMIFKLDSLLNQAVRMQMIADVPVGVFLSGGIDSSIISALMKKQTSHDIHAFTIRFSDSDQKYEKMPDDSFYAREVAKKVGLNYHEFEIKPDVKELLPKMVWHLDEPLSDPATINTYIMSKAARELGIIVLLNGMGGDEIFGGYRKQFACLKAGIYQALIPGFFREIIEKTLNYIPVATNKQGLKWFRWAKRFLSFASLPEYERYLASDLSLGRNQYYKLFRNANYMDTYYYISQKDFFEQENISYLSKMCLCDTKIFLPEHNLTYSDKASMAASVETRPPLTDHNIVEFMFNLNPKYKINRNVQKYLLRKVSEKYLPKNIVYRPKAPFGAPLRSWIRGQLKELVDDLISDNNLKARGIYNPNFVRKLIENDRKGLEDNALVIWTLLTNEIWFRTFFK